ncbi:hypothetical protein OO17_21695 [Rhodopseudomonas palustris]|uniref:Uncharacterized protein n=2 Tax=Nitrobacteraceae TaxID=41294 RepID=A0A0D7EE61_RHOPL|nr:hypothetical protein OO17_21695 [Rhodopseudomonas palustris]
MPIFRHSSAVALASLALLLAVGALLGGGASERFDPWLYDPVTYAPRAAVAEHDNLFTEDATPAERVKDLFDQIGTGKPKPAKRYSSLSTVIR